MANLATTDVTLQATQSFWFGGSSGKKRKLIRAVITGAVTVGGNTNTVPATAFGLTAVEWCSNLMVYTTATEATLRIYPAAPSLSGTTVNFCSLIQSTDANRADVADAVIASDESAVITLIGY